VDYEWRNTLGERYSEYEHGLVSTRVSDWDGAEKCATCGRKIVYIFWVKDKDTGKILPYGSDHLNIALGYSKTLSKTQIDKFKSEFENLAQQRQIRKKDLLNRGEPYFYDSLRSMKKVMNFSPIIDKIGWSTFYKDGNFITILNDNSEDLDILKKEGFKIMNPDEARRLNIFMKE
jgi:hypothetical protein